MKICVNAIPVKICEDRNRLEEWLTRVCQFAGEKKCIILESRSATETKMIPQIEIKQGTLWNKHYSGNTTLTYRYTNVKICLGRF